MSELFMLGTIKAALGLAGAGEKFGIMLGEKPAITLDEELLAIEQIDDGYSKSKWEKAQRAACRELMTLGVAKWNLFMKNDSGRGYTGHVGRFIDLFGRLRNVKIVNDEGADEAGSFRAEVDELWQLKDLTSEFSLLRSGVRRSNRVVISTGFMSDDPDETLLAGTGAMLYGAASTKAALAEAERLREAAPYVTAACALIIKRARAFRKLLERVNSSGFGQLIDKLKKAVDSDVNYARYGQKEKEIVAVSCGIVKEVKTILDTPLFTEDGKVTDESELIVPRVTANLNRLFSRAESICQDD